MVEDGEVQGGEVLGVCRAHSIGYPQLEASNNKQYTREEPIKSHI